MVPGADMFAAWLLGQVADASRKRLTTWVLGSDQERALRGAAVVAIQRMAVELRPEDDEQAKQIVMVVDQVFGQPMKAAPLAKYATLLEALQGGIAEQLAPLGDADLTGTGRSSADWLGVPVAELAQHLTSHLLQEIFFRGSAGGPLAPLANQLNHEKTHDKLDALAAEGPVIPSPAQLPGRSATSLAGPKICANCERCWTHRLLERRMPSSSLPWMGRAEWARPRWPCAWPTSTARYFLTASYMPIFAGWALLRRC